MFTSVMHNLFGVRGYKYVATKFSTHSTSFVIACNPDHLCCSACGSSHITHEGYVTRKVRSLPFGSRKIFIEAEIPRLLCHDCNVIRQATINFAEPKRSYTKSFERYALELSAYMTIKDIANHLGISWDIIKGIQKKHLLKKYSRPRLKDLKEIAIDEIYIGKKYKFISIVMDLETGMVVYIGDGKGSEALIAFWKRLRSSGAKIDAVAIDMSPAFISAVLKNLPKAKLVFDRFHVIKLFNEKLTQLRRALHNEVTTALKKKSLKGIRWLLLKRPENLDPAKQEPKRLKEALRLNEPLAVAYHLKEELNEIWEQDDQETAQALLMDWIVYAESTGITILKRFAKTLRAHAMGILAWYDANISTGPLEGTNNKIKTMKRQAYGFRDKELLKLKIMGIHETTYALIG